MHQPTESWADSLIEKIELDVVTMVGIITIFKLEKCVGHSLTYNEIDSIIDEVLYLGE